MKELEFNKEPSQNPLLTQAQEMGIQNFGLTIEDVHSPNFGDQILDGIAALLSQDRVETPQEAFEIIRELGEQQIQGVVIYDMTRSQVLDEQFGIHTLNGINALLSQNRARSKQDAAQILTGLNPDQAAGLVAFGFTRDQVLTTNYGEHTNEAIQHLNSFRRVQSFPQALQIVTGLNPIQTRGIIDFRLGREQVQSPNFGQHTLTAIRELVDNRRVDDFRAAFNLVRGFDETQTNAVNFYGLRRNQVLSPNFGRHTLAGMWQMRFSNPGLSFRQAFRALEGLQEHQVRGVANFGLTREQVEQPRYIAGIANALTALQAINPEASGENLLNFAMEMPEYQIRAISEHNFTAEQLGIVVENNEFVQSDLEGVSHISGSDIDAIAHLISEEGMDREEAQTTATELNSTQIISMIDLGLSLEQVQIPLFQNEDGILDVLLENTRDEEGEFNIPILPEDRDRVRALMAQMILESENPQNELLNSVTSTENLPSGIDVLLDDQDLNEFLSYAFERDFLGIFDGILGALENNTQESLPAQVSNARDIEETEQEIMKFTLATTGVAAMPRENENNELEGSVFEERNLGAFTIPVSPKFKSEESEESTEKNQNRKPAAKKNNNQERDKSKRNGPKR
ncbi:hypothetical protein [Ascidiimonas sp. W6]|uniref:hypothetical protein n=1 Tax=Ascidiimonas meishanensis TaxID=3128903 RepID=UPI0030EF5092